LLTALFCSPVLADTEFWSTDTFQTQIREGVKFNVIPELRFRNNAGEFYYLLTYLGPTLYLSKNFDLNFYLAPKLTKSGSVWKNSTIGFIDAVYKNGLFSDRLRLEEDLSVNCLKIRDQFQVKMNGWFVNDEVFYNFNRGFFDENRLAVGYVCKILPNFDLAPGYLLRHQRASGTADWTKTDVLTLNASVRI
jgi:hypothetical protein